MPPRSALTQRLWLWGILLGTALLRLWNLAYPAKLVFDETYYVKDALTLSLEGHEKAWGENANPGFESGEVFSYLPDSAFVVHPPLGKWIIASGMWLFGPANSFGWRFAVAISGIISVYLLILIAKRLFRSWKLALVAGGLLAIDGLAIVISRTALLDGPLTFFLLAGFLFFLIDQEKSRAAITNRVLLGKTSIIWFRPWLILTGLTLGLATAIKWSGLYLLAGIGLYLVISELLLRKSIGQGRLIRIGLLSQGAISFLNLVPIALIAYLSSWSGWILTRGGYARDWAEQNPAEGIWALFPKWLSSLLHYHQVIYNFHISLNTAHAYASNPITWLLTLRPTAFFYESKTAGEAGCQSLAGCSSAITALGNPLIWLPATAALIYLVYRYIRHRERVVGLILLGVGVQYLPWLLLSQRTVFQFYSISFLPWMILALVLVGSLVRQYLNGVNPILARRLVFGYFLATATLAIFFLPIYLGLWIPFDLWQLRMWLPGWI